MDASRKASMAASRKASMAASRKASMAASRKASMAVSRKISMASSRKPSMATSRKPSMVLTHIPGNRLLQWEELMRNFSLEHEEQCTSEPVNIPTAPRKMKHFPTGSKYEGTWDVLGMSGYGIYTFPSGVVYEGDFEDGMFEGKGELRYGNGLILHGKWQDGVMTDRTLQLSDSLEFSEENWKYCEMPDRRFAIEYDLEVMPAGQSYLTADQPTKEIPPGHFDTGDGFYNLKNKAVYKYTDLTSMIRSPSAAEQLWIEQNCRVCPDDPLGPRPDLYENWSEPVLRPVPPPMPAAGVKTTVCSFRQQSVYEQDFDFLKGLKFFDTGSPSESSTSTSDN